MSTDEEKYILGENSINGITLDDKIRDEELHEYYIVDREEFLDKLIGWISEARSSDKILMKEDLKMLMTWDDEYILTSNATNSYIGKDSEEFNETCKELLELNDSINKTMSRLDFLLEDKNLEFESNSIIVDRLGFLNRNGRKVMDIYDDTFYVYDQNLGMDEEILEIIKLIQSNYQNETA